MPTTTVHRSTTGADIDLIVAQLNALIARVAELTTKVNTHLTDGVHRADGAPSAGLPLVTATAINDIALGY